MATKQDFSHLKVGDGIWMTKRRYRQNEDNGLELGTVSKVGRKYLSVGEGWSEEQFHINSGIEKNETNYKRQLILSPYQYDADRKRDAIWTVMRNRLQNMWSIDGVDEGDIRAAAKLLGIELT
jgi:hypothetical protein